VKNLSEGEAKCIYGKMMKEANVDKFATKEMKYAYFDAVVNHGPRLANKIL